MYSDAESIDRGSLYAVLGMGAGLALLVQGLAFDVPQIMNFIALGESVIIAIGTIGLVISRQADVDLMEACCIALSGGPIAAVFQSAGYTKISIAPLFLFLLVGGVLGVRTIVTRRISLG